MPTSTRQLILIRLIEQPSPILFLVPSDELPVRLKNFPRSSSNFCSSERSLASNGWSYRCYWQSITRVNFHFSVCCSFEELLRCDDDRRFINSTRMAKSKQLTTFLVAETPSIFAGLDSYIESSRAYTSVTLFYWPGIARLAKLCIWKYPSSGVIVPRLKHAGIHPSTVQHELHCQNIPLIDP